MTEMLQYLVIGHIVVASITTIIVFRLDYFERPQAIGQTAVVWLVPLFGALVILVFQTVIHRNMTTRLNADSEYHYREEGAAVDLYHDLSADD